MSLSPFAARLAELQRWAKYADIAHGPPIKEGSDCRGFGDLGLDLQGGDMYRALSAAYQRRELLESNAEAILALVEAATLRHNAIISEYVTPSFKGEWIAIPREDFDTLRAALEALSNEP